MDGLLSTVLAGIIVALIGSFAAYYFGVRQERQRRHYERQRDAEEDQEEIQKVLNRLGAAALDQMRPQILSLVGEFDAWLQALSEYKSDWADERKSLSTALLRRWREQGDNLVNRASVVSQEMPTLRLEYWKQKPSLSKTRCPTSSPSLAY
jgi:hypothetical protein